LKWKIETNLQRVKFAREAGVVKRCHREYQIGTYDVAQHTYNMLSTLRVLYPNVPVEVVWNVLSHDQPERLTGDFPATSKWYGLVDDEALGHLECGILDVTLPGIQHELDPVWTMIVKGIDLLELYMWTKDQLHFGNLHIQPMMRRIERWFKSKGEAMPQPVMSLFFDAYDSDWTYLPELIDAE